MPRAVLSRLLSHAWLFETLWTVARQAALSMGIIQARILEWVAMPSYRGSSQLRDWIQVSPHCRWIPYHLSHQGSPRILEGVSYPFSRASSRPGNQTGVFCIAGRFFTSWATREALAWHGLQCLSSMAFSLLSSGSRLSYRLFAEQARSLALMVLSAWFFATWCVLFYILSLVNF